MARLLALRMKGFKTFARPTELTFEPGVAVVIGPNGSGKSNIADAVLWALGEQSPSNIRGRTMQDVIFAGSDGRRAAAGAEVALVFDNASGALPLDYREIEISRWATRDGGSGYRLNGVSCRLTDIQELIAAVGLGREMHSVISQGKVEEFLSSTPQTRRALVEEAAGLGRYKKRRQRAQSKLEKAHDNLARVKDVEREVRNALRPLKQQVTAAERFAEATEELAAAQARLALLDLLELRAARAKAEARLNALRSQREQAEAELACLREERGREEQVFTESLKAREALATLYHQTKAEVERLESRAASLRQRVARLDGERARSGRRRELVEADLQAAATRLAEAERSPLHSAGRLAFVTGAVNSLTEALAQALPAVHAAEEEETGLKDEVFDLEASRSRLAQEREFLSREVQGRRRRLEELGAQEEAGVERMAVLEAGLRELTVELSSSEEQARRAAAAFESTGRELEDLRNRAAAARAREHELLEAEQALASRRRVLQGTIARGEGLPAAARAIRAEQPGACLLAEALRVEEGYERAVAAALGPLAQAVLLPGERDLPVLAGVEGAVELLWSGAGTGEAMAPLSGPSGSRPLGEIVSGPAEALHALARLLPPTYVVSSLEGMTVPDGARLVSLTGELLTGSGHAARRGEPGAEVLFAARTEVEALEAETARTAAVLAAARAAAQEANAGLEEAEAALRRQEEAARESGRAAAGLKDEIELFSRRLEEARTEQARLEEREAEEERLTAELGAQAEALEVRQRAEGRELEERRLRLRAVREEAEALRLRASRLEQKRSQASLLAVRLKERQRMQEEERARADARLRLAGRAVEAASRREQALGEVLPRVAELEAVTARIAALVAQRVVELEQRVEESRRSADDFAQVLKEQGRREAELQQRLSALGEGLVEVQVGLAHLEDRAGERERELDELCRRHLSPRGVTPDQLEGAERSALAAAAEQLERRRERIGPVNPLAEQEYRETAERADFLAEQRRDLEESLTELKRVIADLDTHIETTFSDVFAATKEHFVEMVSVLFPGGKGVLKLVEPDPASGAGSGSEEAGDDEAAAEDSARPQPGISLEIKPPKKAPRSMSLLSGGEKALAAIAFLFALFLARPCPFYILDEVEAALDDVNISRFLSLVRRYQGHAQFIIVTHQRRTMEIADTLYGVAMDTDGTSRVLSRRLAGAGSG